MAVLGRVCYVKTVNKFLVRLSIMAIILCYIANCLKIRGFACLSYLVIVVGSRNIEKITLLSVGKNFLL